MRAGDNIWFGGALLIYSAANRCLDVHQLRRRSLVGSLGGDDTGRREGRTFDEVAADVRGDGAGGRGWVNFFCGNAEGQIYLVVKADFEVEIWTIKCSEQSTAIKLEKIKNVMAWRTSKEYGVPGKRSAERDWWSSPCERTQMMWERERKESPFSCDYKTENQKFRRKNTILVWLGLKMRKWKLASLSTLKQICNWLIHWNVHA